MKRIAVLVLLAVALSTAWPLCAQQLVLSVCDYAPPESHVSTLDLQGSFSWYDGPFADDRSRSLAASFVADYGGLDTSESFAQQLDLLVDVRRKTSGWTAELGGDGSMLAFWENDTFAVGALGFDATSEVRLEADLSAGIGVGRFRDVTPLAQAIRMQNALLDLGELLAPLSNVTLLDLAAILGEVGPSDDERIVRIAERLLATDLTPGEDLGVRALLEIDRLLTEPESSRLCGGDLQARVGVSAALLPDVRLSATGILLGRYALVPDPVSQFDALAEAKIRLTDPSQMILAADASYARRLPDGWTARATYRLDLDRFWTDPAETTWAHALSSSLTTQVFGGVGLSLVANAEYRTGDEELTLSVGLHLEASF